MEHCNSDLDYLKPHIEAVVNIYLSQAPNAELVVREYITNNKINDFDKNLLLDEAFKITCLNPNVTPEVIKAMLASGMNQFKSDVIKLLTKRCEWEKLKLLLHENDTFTTYYDDDMYFCVEEALKTLIGSIVDINDDDLSVNERNKYLEGVKIFSSLSYVEDLDSYDNFKTLVDYMF